MKLQVVMLLVRAQVRRQLGCLALMTLLAALVFGVVLAGLVGARRSATVLDRFVASTDQPDLGAFVFGLRAADAPALFKAIPGVRDAASMDIFLAQPTVPGGDQSFTIVSSPDGRWGIDISRVLVREGRMPDPDRADEVVLNRPAARVLGLEVGDRLDVQTPSPASFERFISPDGGDGSPLALDGPHLNPRIVGIVEAGEDLQGSTERSAPLAIGSAAFGRRYDGKVAVGGSNTAITSDDPEVVDRVRAAVASYQYSGVTTADDEWVDTTRSAIHVVTIGLIVFAAIALAAGAIAIGQTISRQVSSSSETLLVSRAVGMTHAERVLAVGTPVLGAILVGSVVGVGLALASSGLFPMAIARAAEPDPGFRPDPAVLSVGWLGLISTLAAWTLLGARRADRRVVAPSVEGSRRSIPVLAQVGRGVSPRLGIRLALDRDPGRSNLPTRSVLVGTAAAIIGVVAVVVFTASLNSSLHTPSEFGWTWSSRPDLQAPDPVAVLDELASDPDLLAVGAVLKSDATVDGAAVPLQAFYSAKGAFDPPVLSGRLPVGPDEVALGSAVLRDTGRSVGDAVDIALPDAEPRILTVVGEIVGNQMTELPDLGVVAMVTTQGAAQLLGVPDDDALIGSRLDANLLLTYRSGVPVATVEARLTKDHQLSFVDNSRPTAPGRLLNLDDMRALLVGIAVFLAAIGTLALVHLLVVSTRRRAREFGTLRAIGLIRRQLRATVWFQALTIVVVGLVVGLPLGIAVGRWTWRATLDGVGMVIAPTIPWPALVGLVLIGLIATSLISMVPGWRATDARPASLPSAER